MIAQFPNWRELEAVEEEEKEEVEEEEKEGE
jgi:hypothetical protein